MRTLANSELDAIRVASAKLNYVDPVWVSAEIVACQKKGRFAVVGRDSEGNERVYGAVGGQWNLSPILTNAKSKLVFNHLTNN
jgi:hypothetical protein